jgi:hypothetical protein
MLGLTWCYIKTGFGIFERYYQSTPSKQNFGLGEGSTAVSNIWYIIHVVLMDTFSTYFINIVLVSVSSNIQHNRICEGLIYDTGLEASSQASTEITSTSNDAKCYGSFPAPIDPNATWRIIGGNMNGLKQYGTMAALVTVAEILCALHVGTIAFSETNVEWMLIPQVRPAHKYPISPWEMIHPPGGDNAVCR